MYRSKCLSLFEVFKKNYTNLVKLLPMKDDVFVAELYTHDLISFSLKETLRSEPVSTTKATLFLDSAIEPTVSINDSTKLDVLLEIMKGYSDKRVRQLGETISSMLNQGSGTSKAGKIIL